MRSADGVHVGEGGDEARLFRRGVRQKLHPEEVRGGPERGRRGVPAVPADQRRKGTVAVSHLRSPIKVRKKVILRNRVQSFQGKASLTSM